LLTTGTRGSDLALWQADWAQARLHDFDVKSQRQIIKTQGDNIQNVPFAELDGKGFFTKEIETKGRLFDRDREVIQLHFGGGTPTFFSDTQLSAVMQ